ncbi:MAG: LPS-assembly protein LptD [Bacteroidales bacterium]|jgi:hypothetical protein|nr:LPS-assembly protein LptD [Bacteroidales bacterium]
MFFACSSKIYVGKNIGNSVENFSKDSILLKKNIEKNLSDSIINDTTEIKDSINFPKDSIFNDENVNEILSDTLANDTINFSIDTKNDSIKIHANPKKKSDFDAPVHYTFDQKGKLDFNNKKAYLYKNANVKYENINLTADYMEMDFDKKEVFANGFYDTVNNKVSGKPVYKDGEEEYVADSIRYNFNTKRGLVKNVSTKLDDGYLYGQTTKIYENKHVHILSGKYTTCDNPDCPHFYFRLSKAVVIPNDKIVSGPVYMVIEEIPTPLALPFGFFPNTDGGHSGIVIPNFGDEQRRGFFLQNGGYYFNISERFDLTLLGDIYSKGSWGVSARANYKFRYKFNGYFSAKVNTNKFGYKGLPNYETNRLYEVIWKFNQDPKRRPNSTFSADVNISSSKFNKNNSYNSNDFMTSNQQSSISYSHNFENTPFNLSAAFRHTQNNNTGTINFTLPDVVFSMSKIYPLKRKIQKGGQKWYENIGLSYTMNLTNRIKTNENSFFTIPFDSITNGISHKIPISTSIKLFKYTTLTPNFTYNERWYIKSMEKNWIDTSFTSTVPGYVESNYKSGFSRAWDYNAGVNWTTQIYGTFQFLGKSKLKAIRHVFTPTVSFNYVPDLSKPKYKMYDDYYQIRYNNSTGQYDTVSYMYGHFEGLPYGGPSQHGSGLVTFDLGNNLELKLKGTNKNPNDTVTPVDKKVKLLESFSVNTSYNLFADSLRWSPINISARTRITLFDISFRTTLDPYGFQFNDYGSPERINKWSYNTSTSNHKILRLTSMYITVGFSLNPKSKKNNSNTAQHYQEMYGQPIIYADWSIPWDVQINYSFNYNKPYNDVTITQSLNISGSVSITEKWKATVSTGYDFVRKEITYTTIDITRDLHCWEASLNMRPFGAYKSYMFQINVKAAMLQDLRLKKQKTWYDNFQ